MNSDNLVAQSPVIHKRPLHHFPRISPFFLTLHTSFRPATFLTAMMAPGDAQTRGVSWWLVDYLGGGKVFECRKYLGGD